MSSLFPSGSMANKTAIKLALEGPNADEGPFVRIQVTDGIGPQLLELIRKRALDLWQATHGISANYADAKVHLTYRDIENDLCYIFSEDDLKCAFLDFSSLRILARVNNGDATTTKENGTSSRQSARASPKENTGQVRNFSDIPVHKVVETVVGVLTAASIALQKHVKVSQTRGTNTSGVESTKDEIRGTNTSDQEIRITKEVVPTTKSTSSPKKIDETNIYLTKKEAENQGKEATTNDSLKQASQVGTNQFPNQESLDATKDFPKPILQIKDLQQDEPEELKQPERLFIHGRHTCDGCLSTPIVGKRFHAVNMPDYDLCAACRGNYVGSDIQFEEQELERDRPMQERWYRRFNKWNQKNQRQAERNAMREAKMEELKAKKEDRRSCKGFNRPRGPQPHVPPPPFGPHHHHPPPPFGPHHHHPPPPFGPHHHHPPPPFGPHHHHPPPPFGPRHHHHPPPPFGPHHHHPPPPFGPPHNEDPANHVPPVCPSPPRQQDKHECLNTKNPSTPNPPLQEVDFQLKEAIRRSLEDLKKTDEKEKVESITGTESIKSTGEDCIPQGKQKLSADTAEDQLETAEFIETENVNSLSSEKKTDYLNGCEDTSEVFVEDPEVNPEPSAPEEPSEVEENNDIVDSEEEFVIPPEAPVGAPPARQLENGADDTVVSVPRSEERQSPTSSHASKKNSEESFANDAEGNGDVAAALGETMDAIANAIDAMLLDEFSTKSDGVLVDALSGSSAAGSARDTTSKAGATILSGEEEEEEEVRSEDGSQISWDVVGNNDDALARAARVIGSALLESQSKSQTSTNEAVSMLGSDHSVPTTLPSVASGNYGVTQAQLDRWVLQLNQLHELGFLNDALNIETMERLEAANIGSDLSEEISVERVVNELMKNW